MRAGVDSIEHGSYLDQQTIDLFKKHNAYLVPTLLAGQTVSKEVLSNPNMPAAIANKVRTVVPQVEASFKLALKNNINKLLAQTQACRITAIMPMSFYG